MKIQGPNFKYSKKTITLSCGQQYELSQNMENNLWYITEGEGCNMNIVMTAKTKKEIINYLKEKDGGQ
jgi:hypothetical protein